MINLEPVKKVAVAGATGRIGTLTVEALRAAGHTVVELSRSRGVDLQSGSGLADALTGVDSMIDCTNSVAQTRGEVVDFFSTATSNLLAAEERAGVGHHVVLSIAGLAEPAYSPHYAGKLAQEAAVIAGPVPWSIVRATQFHDFAEMVVGWTEQNGAATIAPLLVQPIAPVDVAEVLVETALGAPLLRRFDIAGPEQQDLVDMARRTLAARNRNVRLIPTWDGTFNEAMAGRVLLPGPDARIMPTTFDEWLADISPPAAGDSASSPEKSHGSTEILAQEGYTSIVAAETPARELFPGIRVRDLWEGPSGAHAHVLELDPGTAWPHRDVHEPGPEEVYVLSGTFNDGARDYPAGTFLHAPASTWHVPSTREGCCLFLFYPEG